MKPLTIQQRLTDLNDKIELLFNAIQTVKTVNVVGENPSKKGFLATQVDLLIHNAFASPQTTIMGVLVGVTHISEKFFPQYSEVLSNSKTFFEVMTGVSATSSPKPVNKPITPKTTIPDEELYG